MKYFLTILLMALTVLACKQKVLSGAELKNKLIETMQNFLDKDDHPGIEFKVKDVNYYTEVKEKSYDCVFHVSMRTAKTDTLGTMIAVVSNDFKKVDRKR